MEAKLKRKFDILNADLHALLTVLDGLSEAQLHNKPEGAWSAVQVLYHLVISEERTVSYLNKKLDEVNVPVEKAGLGEKIRALLLSRALRNDTKKFKAPSIVAELPDKPDYAETKKRYLELRIAMAAMLEKFDANKVNRAYFKHPRAGKLSIGHTLDFMQDHFTRHKKQMMARSAQH